MTSWRVWLAQRNEAAILASVEEKSFQDRSWGKSSVMESFDAPGVFVLLGGSATATPSGFAIWRDLAGEAELLSIGVIPAARRTGLGAGLLSAALDGAREQNCATMFLEVDAGNEAAKALYRRYGFVQTGLRRGYYRDGADAALMSVSL